MPTLHLLFAQRNAAAQRAAADGIRRAFGGVVAGAYASLDEALLQDPGRGGSLLILIQPDLAEIELAVKARLADGSARWAVVCLGAPVRSSGLENIPEEDWHPALLAQVFRAAAQKHELTRENARLRGDLLTIARRISHDLRTPLSGIFTTAELLKEILEEQSPDDAALTTPLFDSTQAVLKLIERVSQMAKATVETPPAEAVSMGQVVWAARQGAERAAMKLGVKMTEPADWPQVQGVPAWLEVIWANLLVNAVNHGGKNGPVEMQWRELPGEFEFSVRDHGPGVVEKKRPSLFQAFEKLHQSQSASGLGLPIVRRLVELQGGRCGYEPAADGGSRFYFTLPKGPSVPVPVAAT